MTAAPSAARTCNPSQYHAPDTLCNSIILCDSIQKIGSQMFAGYIAILCLLLKVTSFISCKADVPEYKWQKCCTLHASNGEHGVAKLSRLDASTKLPQTIKKSKTIQLKHSLCRWAKEVDRRAWCSILCKAEYSSPTDFPPEPNAHRPPQETLLSFSSTCATHNILHLLGGACNIPVPLHVSERASEHHTAFDCPADNICRAIPSLSSVDMVVCFSYEGKMVAYLWVPTCSVA